MSPPRHSLRRPEPLGDRPIELDICGDVWQRQGPAGTRTWYSAQAGTHFEFGRSWPDLWDAFGPMAAVPRLRLADPGYTTESIPVIRE